MAKVTARVATETRLALVWRFSQSHINRPRDHLTTLALGNCGGVQEAEAAPGLGQKQPQVSRTMIVSDQQRAPIAPGAAGTPPGGAWTPPGGVRDGPGNGFGP